MIPSQSIRYYVYESTENDSLLGLYLTYGIRMDLENELYALYPDLSTHKEEVSRWVRRLNEEQLPPYQFPEILEDLLP